MTEQKSTTMRGLFPTYYLPTDEEFKELWEKCIFIFDTNVLLNMYLPDPKSLDEFLNTLKAVNDRLWIPYQVAVEFQRNRVSNIKKKNKEVRDLKTNLTNVKDKIIKEFKKHPSIYSQEIIEDTNKQFKLLLESLYLLEEKQPKANAYDNIREQIDKLFENKIGNPLTQDELNSIYEEGEKRYEKEVPPGYKDKVKEKESPYECNGLIFKSLYGDLIIWKEILKQAKEQKWEFIIWVTDDEKEDWWFKDEDDGSKLGPRHELIEEALKCDITRFYMYSSEYFLKYAKQYIPGIEIDDESIKQVGEFIELAREQEDEEYKTDLLRIIDPYAVELMVLDWLQDKHSFEEIKPKSEGIDFICTATSSTSSSLNYVGYELKIVRGSRLSRSGMERMLMQILTYIQSEHLDKAYLIYVIEPSQSIALVLSNFTISINNLKLNMPYTTLKIGLIVGTITNRIDSSSVYPYFIELARIEV